MLPGNSGNSGTDQTKTQRGGWKLLFPINICRFSSSRILQYGKGIFFLTCSQNYVSKKGSKPHPPFYNYQPFEDGGYILIQDSSIYSYLPCLYKQYPFMLMFEHNLPCFVRPTHWKKSQLLKQCCCHAKSKQKGNFQSLQLQNVEMSELQDINLMQVAN